MAHFTQVKGTLSEMKAAIGLMSLGWEISKPLNQAEVYDLQGYHPITGDYGRFQVKSIRQRSDRNNELVIYARKGNGEPYTPNDCEYIIGVLGDKAYMLECTGLSEYWSSEAKAAKRWVEIPLN